MHCYRELRRRLQDRSELAWLQPLVEESGRRVQDATHGDQPRWLAAIEALPSSPPGVDLARAAPTLGGAAADQEALAGLLMELHPWRKGPLRLGGVRIDSEWRSDLKWDRIASHVELAGHAVLDVGAGNGYYGWRMLGAGAELVVGIDPTLVYVMQWLAAAHFSGDAANYVLPLGIQHVPAGAGGFDSVFSMGVLYHRPQPAAHLAHLAGLARSGGQVVVETLVLDTDADQVLVPDGRYARMRNVWSVPSLSALLGWMRDARLANARVVDVTRTTADEQRSTPWMRFESLRECLDPGDPLRTIEGYPAPVRAMVVAEAAG